MCAKKIVDHWVTKTVGIITVMSIVGGAVFAAGQAIGKTEKRMDTAECNYEKQEVRIDKQDNKIEKQDGEITDIKILLSRFNVTLENNTKAINKLNETIEDL